MIDYIGNNECTDTSNLSCNFFCVKVFSTSKSEKSETDPLGVKKVLVKIINRHILRFGKYNTNNDDSIQQILTQLYNTVFD